MHFDWDVPIEMDDGIVLRADAFRAHPDGSYPVILSYGPYAKGLSFHEGYPDQWRLMTTQHRTGCTFTAPRPGDPPQLTPIKGRLGSPYG
jgi:predicted acyl esterase